MKSYLRNIIILVAMLLVTGISQAQIDSTKVNVVVENDSVYSYVLKHYAKSDITLKKDKPLRFSLFRGHKDDPNFWLGTSSLAIASSFYIAAAWSDPVVYVETHSKYTRNYFNDAINKRNVKIVGGVVFTGLAIYFYSKLRKKKTRWGIGPDGVKYNF